MALLKKTLLLFYFITFALLLCSCQYGAFDINRPNSSSLVISLDGEDITDSIKNGVYTINLDEKQNGFFIFTAKHYKDGKEKSYPFLWKCNTLKFNNIENGDYSIGYNISKSSIIGFHTFTAISSVDDSYNQTISLNIISETTKINLKYTLSESSKVDGIDYSLYESGFLTQDSSVTLVANAKYTIEVLSKDNTAIPNCLFNITSSSSTYGIPFIHILPDENALQSTNVRIIETESEETKENDPCLLTVTYPITNATISIAITTKRLVYATLSETEETYENTSYISLNKEDGTKQYSIHIKGSVSNNQTLYGVLPYAAKKENNTMPSLPNATDENIGWSSLQEFSAFYTEDETLLPYFTLNFDGINHTITITPFKNTVNKSGQNIDFYFYIKDSTNTIIGIWKIMIGGAVEKIETDIYSINSKIDSSGTITATIYPQKADSTVIWYISEQPYNLVSDNKAGTKFRKLAPYPSENFYTKSLISMLTENKIELGTPNDENKYWSLKFEDYPIGQGNTDTLYFDTVVTEPLMVDGISSLLYTLGSASGKFYIIALASNSGYKVFKSIPIVISSDGSITIKSSDGVSPFTYKDDKKIFYDKYTNENNENISLPNRIYQSYPDTAENNSFGVNTRTFYFAHNKESTIDISLQLLNSETFEWQNSIEANKLFTVVENKRSFSSTLTISPLWLTYQKRALQDSSILVPPQDKNDTNNNSTTAYGSFEEFIGIGYIYYKVGLVKGTIRIIIYDANIYEDES